MMTNMSSGPLEQAAHLIEKSSAAFTPDRDEYCKGGRLLLVGQRGYGVEVIERSL